MQNNKPGHHSIKSSTAGYVLAAVFLYANSQAQEQVLAEAEQSYHQAIESELFSEAADAGKGYISALLADPNHDRRQWAAALSRLGYAQHRAGDVDAAIENYRLAVEVMEDQSNRLDASLVEPLLGLSRAQVAAREYREATRSYQRYVHVQQVNEGLHTLAQAEAVNELSEVYFRMGSHQRANAWQQSYVSIFQQNYPGDYMRQLPAHFSHARMLRKTGRMFDSQTAYRHLISNIEKAAGSGSLELLPAIYDMADLLQHNRIVDGSDGSYKARRYLRRAVYIAQKNEDSTPLHVADAHIALGDYLSVQTVDRRAAFRQYAAAWEQLSSDPAFGAERDARFGMPTLLNDIPSQSTSAMRKLMLISQDFVDDYATRLAVRYDINSEGRTSSVEVIDGDPAGYWDSIVENHVDNFVFRPGIVDGEAAEYTDLIYEVHYSYQDRELADDLRQNEPGTQVSYDQ